MRLGNLVSVVLATTFMGPFAAINADASGRRAARMLVYAQEWSFWSSRLSVPAGRVIVQLWNRGQDAHDLKIKRLNRLGRMTGSAQGLGVTQSGAIREGSWRLAPGRYELYCSIPGHLRRGMHVKLLVR
jgi:Sulfocyanin (SoxE) domain